MVGQNVQESKGQQLSPSSNQQDDSQTSQPDNDSQGISDVKSKKSRRIIIISSVFGAIILLGIAAALGYFYFGIDFALRADVSPIDENEFVEIYLPEVDKECFEPTELLANRCAEVGGIVSRVVTGIDIGAHTSLGCYPEDNATDFGKICNSDTDCEGECIWLAGDLVLEDSHSVCSSYLKPLFSYSENKSINLCSNEKIKSCRDIKDDRDRASCNAAAAIRLSDAKYCDDILNPPLIEGDQLPEESQLSGYHLLSDSELLSESNRCFIDLAVRMSATELEKSYDICAKTSNSLASCLGEVELRLLENDSEDHEDSGNLCERILNTTNRDSCLSKASGKLFFYSPTLAEEGFHLCEKITDDHFQRFCFKDFIKVMSYENGIDADKGYDLCQRITNPDYKEQCLHKLSFETFDFDQEKSLELCQKLSNTSLKTLCVEKLANKLSETDPERSANLCAGLSNPLSYCQYKKAIDTKNIRLCNGVDVGGLDSSVIWPTFCDCYKEVIARGGSGCDALGDKVKSSAGYLYSDHCRSCLEMAAFR